MSRRCFLVCLAKNHFHLCAMSLLGDFQCTTFRSSPSTQIPAPTSPPSSMTTLAGTRYPTRATPLLSDQSGSLAETTLDTLCSRSKICASLDKGGEIRDFLADEDTWTTHQSWHSKTKDPSGHRRTYLTSKIVARYGASPGCTGCMGLEPQTDRSAQSESEKALADDNAKLSIAREEPKPADTPVTEPPTQTKSETQRTPKASAASDTEMKTSHRRGKRPDTHVKRQRRSTRQERASIEGPDRTIQFPERALIDLL